MLKKLLIVHGPNLNLLGEREPEVYGAMTLHQLNSRIRTFARKEAIALKFFQSNCEGKLIDFIHKHRKWANGIVMNPGAFTHYSYALRDAISAVALPTVEVHLSDIKNREAFRRVSVLEPVCVRQISGLGWKSYIEGIRILDESLRREA